MFGKNDFLAWFEMIKWVRKNLKFETQLGSVFEGLILENLAKHGVLEYFNDPIGHSFEEMVNDFELNYISSEEAQNLGKPYDDYPKELFEILVARKILVASTDKRKFCVNRNRGDRGIIHFLTPDIVEELRDEKVSREKRKYPFPIKYPSGFTEDMFLAVAVYADKIFERLEGKSSGFTEGIMLFNWDEALRSDFYAMSTRATLRMAEKYGLRKIKEGKIADLGCGIGITSAGIWLYLNTYKKLNVEIVGVDNSKDLLNITSNEFKLILKLTYNYEVKKELELQSAGEFPNITFQQGNVLDLKGFEDESCVAVAMNHVAHWTQNPKKAFQEAYRILKPGGVFFFAETPYTTRSGTVNPVIRVVEGVTGLRPLNEIFTWLEDAGFRHYVLRTPVGFGAAKK